MDRQYIDYLMENRPYSDSSESYTDEQKGGRIPRGIQNRPSGGFPPIFLCERKSTKEEPKEEQKKRREQSTKLFTNISDILQHRRKNITTQQFIPL